MRAGSRADEWPLGYRAKFNYQPRSIVVDQEMGPGYGSEANAYTRGQLMRKLNPLAGT